jgi:hypothetical protein
MSMSSVPPFEEFCITNGSTAANSGWSVRNGATTENGIRSSSTSSRTMACRRLSRRCTSRLSRQLPNIPDGFS